MKRALLCTLIAAALLLCACTRASESTVRAPDAGAPLTLCLGAGPVTLDPARTENGIGATYVVNLFAGLTGYRTGRRRTAELTPELCASLPEPEALPDGRVRYVFTLRDGLTWSDGTPLTAADFVYAWNRACTLEDAAAPYLFACIDGYGTGWLNVAASPDGRTLTVVLAEAMPTFLQLCAQPAYAPVPSGAADTASWTADGAVFAASGPYTVAEWTTEGLTYTKNPAYWDADNVAAETVRFVFQSDPNVAESAFLAREYALSWPVPDAALDDLRTNHAPELRTVSQLGTYSLCFSMSDPALSVFSQTERAQIRTALALLIDRDALCADITPGAQQSANAPIPPGISDADGSAFTSHNGADGKGGGYYGSDHEANCKQAIALLRQVAESSGRFTVNAQGVCAGFPELTYLTSDAAATSPSRMLCRRSTPATASRLRSRRRTWTPSSPAAPPGATPSRAAASALILTTPCRFSPSGRVARAATASPSAAAHTRTTRATASRSTAARKTTAPGRSHTTRCSTASRAAATRPSAIRSCTRPRRCSCRRALSARSTGTRTPTCATRTCRVCCPARSARST